MKAEKITITDNGGIKTVYAFYYDYKTLRSVGFYKDIYKGSNKRTQYSVYLSGLNAKGRTKCINVSDYKSARGLIDSWFSVQ